MPKAKPESKIRNLLNFRVRVMKVYVMKIGIMIIPTSLEIKQRPQLIPVQ
jgi:hypothetical protein